MSEQETELNNSLQELQESSNFDEFKAGLSNALKKSTKMTDSHSSRKQVMVIVNEKKADLILNNPEFKAIIDQNKQRADQDRAIHKAKMSEATSQIERSLADRGLDDFVASTRLKTVDPEELERKSKEKLWCPICVKEDNNGNLFNGKPTCMKCMHELIPQEDLSKYNRAYRRRWEKRRG